VLDDHFVQKAVCRNVSDTKERNACFAEAEEARDEGADECREQRQARRDLCKELGPGRYDPDFDPADFDDDFTKLTNPNPYFPLAIGNRWSYVGGDETVTVEVLAKTKLIEGVTCVVVNDVATENGVVKESTDDWIAQAKAGSAHYCGEISQNLETFAGDDPMELELVDVDGSWKAGRDGAKAGILFLAKPAVGDVYRQEWAPGDAEDAARVLSTTYGFGGKDAELDELVPQELAELLCSAHDCAVTADFSPLEPDALERKYYAYGIGLFLEVSPEDGEIVQLVDCNFDPRCASLPAP
jgi:hypothetical protein